VERINVDGTTDTSFNTIGSNSIVALPNSYIFSLAQQPDGKLLATGTTDGKMFIARFNIDGELDNSFDGDGYAEFFNGDIMAGQDVTTMPDGKILIVGHRETETESSMLCWKLFTDGSLDNSFGNNGVATLYIGSENNFAWFVFSNSDSTAIVGGEIFNGLIYQPVLFHLLTDGTLDNNFGVNGIAGKTFDWGKSIQMNGVKTADGKITYCGTAFENGSSFVGVSRILSNGLLDTTFANNGSATLVTIDSIYSIDNFIDLTVLTNEKIICVGDGYGTYGLLYFRIDSNGTLDTTYGVNGYNVPNQSVDTYGGIIASNENNIYVAQNCVRNILGVEDLIDFEVPFEILLHKLNADGNPDTSFGVGGILPLHFADQGEDAFHCTDLKLQADGKLLFSIQQVHDLGFPFGSESYVFLMRLNKDGSTDSTFATNGIKEINLEEGQGGSLITIRDDGKINGISGYYLNYQKYIAVSRMLSDGSFDTSFDVDGSQIIPVDFGQTIQWLLQSDNKMLGLLSYGDFVWTALLRLNENGSIDTTFADSGYLDLSFLNYGMIGCGLQSDNKILACNGMFNQNVAVARYLNDGSTDSPFGLNGNGVSTFSGVDFGGGNIFLVRLQPDGKILVATENNTDYFVARLLNDIGVSTNENENSIDFYVYPNPVSNQLIIINPFSVNEKSEILIRDLSGKIIKEVVPKFNADYISIPVQEFESGVYIITLITKNSLSTRKFMKQ
ncbi:MAG: T9SS type A sorting domain-containing protein, partial [Chitinophagales bacterium]|nr:T9SS type A sorting domain-containing protein [Chitinophagales bacterium]